MTSGATYMQVPERREGGGRGGKGGERREGGEKRGGKGVSGG
jgi:hypothetical protein